MASAAPREASSQSEEMVLDASRSIVGRLSALASEQVSRKALIEQGWLEDLRAYYGQYTVKILADINAAQRSTAFVKLTHARTNAWAARISDMLFPTDDRNWGIKPTPVPKLITAAKEAVQRAQESVEQANAAHEQNPELAAEVINQAESFAASARQSSAEIEEAKKRCDSMQDAIDDQLIQSKWVPRSREVIEDGCRIGTGIIKGPLTSNRLRQEWRPGKDGQWALAQLPDPQPEAVRVDPWHFFPDMSASKIEDTEFTFERSLPTKKDLRKYALKLGFNRSAVKRLIEEGPGFTNQADVAHIVELKTIAGEGDQIKDRYVMWEYHGPLECDEIAMLLRAAGRAEEAERFLDEKDPLKDYRVVLHFCGNEVLRIAEEWVLDSDEGLYSVWNFSRGDTSIFGIGVPRIMSDSQRAVNGAWRMMMDNSGLSVGPQVVIDKTKITPEDGNWDLKPLKTWLLTGTALSSQQSPFQVFNIPNNQQQLAGIIALAKQFIDEETAMPLIAQGEMGATVQPVGTTSMMFNSANVVFRRIVKAWDDEITTPTIGRFYQWNMQFNPDESVKGDMQVDARGSSVLLVKEMQSQNLIMIMNSWTQHPTIKHYIKVREGLEKVLQTMMIPPSDILEDDETAKANIQAEQEAMAQAAQQTGTDPNEIRLQIAQLQAESRLKVAELEHQTKVAELALRDKTSIAAVQAQLDKEKLKVDSQERRHAVDIAVEDRRAAAARSEGIEEPEAVGVGVG